MCKTYSDLENNDVRTMADVFYELPKKQYRNIAEQIS